MAAFKTAVSRPNQRAAPRASLPHNPVNAVTARFLAQPGIAPDNYLVTLPPLARHDKPNGRPTACDGQRYDKSGSHLAPPWLTECSYKFPLETAAMNSAACVKSIVALTVATLRQRSALVLFLLELLTELPSDRRQRLQAACRSLDRPIVPSAAVRAHPARGGSRAEGFRVNFDRPVRLDHSQPREIVPRGPHARPG